MVFFAQKVLRKVAGNWTFVVVTDRVELDDQIAKTFKAAGAVSEAEGDQCHAASGAHLRELLRGNHRYVFTLIHKFQTPEMLCDRPDVIVLTDEAHRSQYDTLALNMRAALPKALFLAFTGTPLIAGEERTREVFGDYVSIYDFQQSVEDGATVPLFYENRTPELQLVNPGPQRRHLRADRGGGARRGAGSEARAGAGPAVPPDHPRRPAGDGRAGHRAALPRARLPWARRWSSPSTRPPRSGCTTRCGSTGRPRRERVREGTGAADDADGDDSRAGRDRGAAAAAATCSRRTDMAVIVSPGQNEIEQMKKLGLDIVPHRKRMNESQPPLDEKFKDPDDPLRLVFVCAMWLTGFDAPSCSTVYLDKPMRNHTLMQTIARANRVFPGKHSGVIVDYANVFASLEKALAIYGAGKGGESPVQDKQQLVEELRKAVEAATAFCASARRDARRDRGAAGRQPGAACSASTTRIERADLAGPAAARLLRPRAAGRHALPRREARPGGAGVRRPRGLHRDAGRRHPRQAEPEPAGHLAGDGRDQRAARRVHHRP